MYLFHFTQASGIFIVALCTSLDLTSWTWIGVGLNTLASVFDALRQINTKTSAKKLKDIEAISKNAYLDEGDVDIGPEREKSDPL